MLKYYRNRGTNNKPEYILEDSNWLNMRSQKLAWPHPAFGDVDGDNMPDLIVGHLDIDDSKNEDVSERFSVKSLPTQIFVSLKGSQIIELKRIIGLDWSNFKMTYAEIDETRKKNINGEQPIELVKPDEPLGSNAALYDE